MESFHLRIKPLSTNQMHTGKKKDTHIYRKWSRQAGSLLPKLPNIDFTKPLRIHVNAFFRTRASDLDNVWKPLLDMMQRHIEDFNDNKVVSMSATKYIVKDDDLTGYGVQIENCAEPVYEGCLGING